MALNLNQVEAAALTEVASILTSNETTILADLGTVNTNVEGAVASFVDNAAAKVPIIGAIIAAAFAAESSAFTAALANGEKAFVNYLIAWCTAEAAKLSAA